MRLDCLGICRDWTMPPLNPASSARIPNSWPSSLAMLSSSVRDCVVHRRVRRASAACIAPSRLRSRARQWTAEIWRANLLTVSSLRKPSSHQEQLSIAASRQRPFCAKVSCDMMVELNCRAYSTFSDVLSKLKKGISKPSKVDWWSACSRSCWTCRTVYIEVAI